MQKRLDRVDSRTRRLPRNTRARNFENFNRSLHNRPYGSLYKLNLIFTIQGRTTSRYFPRAVTMTVRNAEAAFPNSDKNVK